MERILHRGQTHHMAFPAAWLQTDVFCPCLVASQPVLFGSGPRCPHHPSLQRSLLLVHQPTQRSAQPCQQNMHLRTIRRPTNLREDVYCLRNAFTFTANVTSHEDTRVPAFNVDSPARLFPNTFAFALYMQLVLNLKRPLVFVSITRQIQEPYPSALDGLAVVRHTSFPCTSHGACGPM